MISEVLAKFTSKLKSPSQSMEFLVLEKSVKPWSLNTSDFLPIADISDLFPTFSLPSIIGGRSLIPQSVALQT